MSEAKAKILLIDMQSGGDTCCVCGKEDLPKWGIPVGTDGRIISNESVDEWAGKPACRDCWKRHEAGEFVGQYPSY